MRSIRRRLVVPLLAGSCLLTLAAGLLLSNLISRRLLAELDQALLAKARALVTLTRQAGGEVEIDFADELMPEYSARTAPEYFQLWLADGTVLERSRSLGERDLPRFPSLANEPLFRDVRLPDGRPGRMVEIAFVPQLEDDDHPLAERLLDPTAPLPDSLLRAAVLTTARSRQELDALIRSLYAVSVAVAALLASGLGLLVHFSIRHGLRPLDEIGRQVETLDAERLDLRIGTNPPVLELSPVVERLNALLARLQVAFERERRFSSDIAHELRTPIAELRNLAAVGARWPEDRDLVRSYFQDVDAVSRQMEQIVVNLLSLARCDSGQEVFERNEVELRELIEETWGRFAPDAKEKTLMFELTAQPSLTAVSDRGKLSLILSNFLSNAVAYSPAGSTVSCSAEICGDQLEITVSNPAPQLEAEDLPHLFDRFWRKDPARSDSLHAGLGLPLAKAFAELLGLHLTAELAAGRRLLLRLCGPRGLGALLLLIAGALPGFAAEPGRGVARFGETITVEEEARPDRPGVVESRTGDEVGQPPSTQAAEAAAHLPGVTVEGELGEADRVLVRGAEARLVATTLNGERLPSPDGERRSAGLSLVPAWLLEEVTVAKTLSPDRDADAIGGTVELVTHRAPAAGLSTFELTGGAAWPSQRPLYGGSLALGHRLLKGRLGVLTAALGESSEREVEGLLARSGDEGLEQIENQDYELFQERLGALSTVDWAASATTALELRGLYSRNTTRELRRRVKRDLEDDLVERELKDADRWRELLAVSASGSRLAGSALLEISLGSNAASEREPDRVDTSFVSEPASEDPADFLLDKIGVEDNTTRENNRFAALDLSWSVLQAGVKVRDKTRRRDLGMTLFHPEEEISLLDWTGSGRDPRIDPERARQLLASLGMAGERGLAEETADYRATETTAAAYLQAEVKRGRLTLLPGLRHERTRSAYSGFELTAGGTADAVLRPLRGESSYGLWLPMLHAALALREDLELHAALTRGFARPDYFDLVPYRLLDADDLEIEEGNAGLRPTRSWNLDGRLDGRPGSHGSIGAGLFYRDLTDFTFVRRRQVELDGETWEATRPENGERARLYGGEIVVRWRLPRETGPLAGWGLQASSTWTRSEARLTGGEGTLRLPGQAPWAGSLTLSFDRHRMAGTLAIAWAGRSVAELGATREEDLVRDRRHRLDLALSYAFTSGLRVRLEAMNLTDDPFRLEYGASGVTAREESYGRSLRCSFSAGF